MPPVAGNYDARMRVLAQYVARKFSVRWQDVEEFERTTVRLLKEQEHEMTESVSQTPRGAAADPTANHNYCVKNDVATF